METSSSPLLTSRAGWLCWWEVWSIVIRCGAYIEWVTDSLGTRIWAAQRRQVSYGKEGTEMESNLNKLCSLRDQIYPESKKFLWTLGPPSLPRAHFIPSLSISTCSPLVPLLGFETKQFVDLSIWWTQDCWFWSCQRVWRSGLEDDESSHH